MIWPFSYNKNKQPRDAHRTCGLYDTHSHLLWGLDDGARSQDESVAWMERYAALGYRGVMVTPHNNHHMFPTPNAADVKNKLKALASQSARTGVQLRTGAEIMCVGDYLNDIREGRYFSAGNAFLVEFQNHPGALSAAVERVLFKTRMEGITLILAHPERYVDIQINPEIATSLRAKGMLMQINLGSLVGRYGRRVQSLAWEFVKHDIADIAATDAHRLQDFDMVSLALDELEWYDPQRFETLVSSNPRLIFDEMVEHITDMPG